MARCALPDIDRLWKDDAAEENSPLFDVKAEDVERIEYANDSVPLGECAEQYTQNDEIEKILNMIGKLKLLKEKPDDLRDAPGFSEYRIYLKDGTYFNVVRTGGYVMHRGNYYKGELPRLKKQSETEREPQ